MLPSLEERQRLMRFALSVFEDALGLLHPLMPFVTEEIWHRLGMRDQNESLCVTLLPQYNSAYERPQVEELMRFLMEIVEQLRMLKATAGLKPNDLPPACIRVNGEWQHFIAESTGLIAALARVEQPTLLTDHSKPHGALSAIVRDAEVFLIVGEQAVERERQRLIAERERLHMLLAQTRSRLNNEQFIQRAKPEIIEKERSKEATLAEALRKVEESLQYFSQQS